MIFKAFSYKDLNDLIIWYEHFNILIVLYIQLFIQDGGHMCVFNRPIVAGAVLQAPLSLIDWLTDRVILFLQIFKTP